MKPENNNNAALERALLASLHDQIVAIVIATAIVVIANIYSYHSQIPEKTTLIFIFLMSIVFFFRIANYFFYKKFDGFKANPGAGINVIVLLMLLTGALWGWLGIQLMRSIAYENLLIFYLSMGGMITGAVATAAASVRAFYAYTAPIILPVLIYYFATSESTDLTVVVLVLAYFFVSRATCLRINRIIRSSIQYGLENAELAENLKKKQKQILGLNARLAETVGEQLEIMDHLEKSNLEHEHLAQELMHMSTTDALTGIANRRAFDDAFKKSWNVAMREQSHLSLILMDVDFFKSYNDLLGHAAGDDCLRMIAAVLSEHARRANELLCRYGGEEFILLLPGKTADQAAQLAEAIRDDVERHKITHPDPAFEFVTVSAGVSCVEPNKSMNSQDIFDKADSAMYASKNAGRNKVTVFSDEDEKK